MQNCLRYDRKLRRLPQKSRRVGETHPTLWHPVGIYNTLIRGLIRSCQTTALVLLLAGCSGIQLAYNNLDWLLAHRLASYMPLNDQQDSQLDNHIKQFLQWHCTTQVGAYAQLLREVNGRFQSSNLTRAEVAAFNTRIEQVWMNIMQQAGPPIAGILVTANETQVQKLFKGFEKRNAEWLQEFEDDSPEVLRRNYQKRMDKELRRWFGKLDKQQRQTLTAWSGQFQPLGLEGLETRRRWQTRLQKLMPSRTRPDEFRREFAKLLANPGELRTALYLQRSHNNRTATIDMLYSIISQLSDKQKQHLQKKVNAVAGDFDNLVCRSETETSS